MRNLFFTVAALTVSGLVLAGCFGSNSSDSTTLNTSGSTEAGNPFSEENSLLRKGDFLSVQLSGVPAPDAQTYSLKIDENGNIAMPHIGEIKAADTTTVVLKNKIETLYKTNRIYTNPTITINSYMERYVSVSGEVRNQTRLLYNKDLTVLGAIAAGGGFTDYANRDDCQLIRNGISIRFDAKAALKDPKKDVPLLPNDIVHVKRSIF